MLGSLTSGMSVLETAEQIGLVEGAEVVMTDDALASMYAVALESELSGDEMAELLETCGLIQLTPVEERTVVKLDKKAKKNKLYKLAVYEEAKDKGDPDYKKLCTLWKMVNYLTRKLEKKHGTRAKARVKTMQKKSAESKVAPIKKLSNALTRSEKESQKAKNLKAAPKGLAGKANGIIAKMQSKIG